MKKKSFLRYPVVFTAVFLAAVMSLSVLQVFAGYPVIPNSVSGLTIAYGSYCEISNQTETGFDVTVSGYKDSSCNQQPRTGTIYFDNDTSEDIKISFDYTATISGGSSWSGKLGETAMKDADTVKGLVIPADSHVEMAITSPVGEGASVKVSVTNLVSVDMTSYTLAIPAKLDVNNAGWNATDGIGAAGVLEKGKRLTVTADSNGEYALVSGENKVNYKLAENGDKDTTYDNAAETTSWEFTSLTGCHHRGNLGFVLFPVRIEHARYTRHRQHKRIGLQQTIFQFGSHRVTLSAKLIAVTLVRVVRVNKRHGILGFACAQQAAAFAAAVVETGDTVVECRIFRCEIKCQRVPARIVQVRLQHVRIAVPIFHDGEIGLGCRIVVTYMRVVESFAVVITEAVVQHLVLHPFQVRLAHVTYGGVIMIPVTSGFIVCLRTVAVVGCTGCFAFACTGTVVIVHLVGAANPRSLRLELTVLTEIQVIERAPRLACHMVHHDICHHLASSAVQRFDQVVQCIRLTPIGILIAVLKRQVAYTTCSLARRRQPYEVEICGNLTG